jgi:hypothetical protein
MEQYKINVEMSDRISARRSITNTFFLTLHSILIGILGLSLSRAPYVPHIGLLLMPLLGLLFLCYAWWRLVQNYRHIAEAKAKVICELERRLPCNASLLTEKTLSKHGKRFSPRNRLEMFMPYLFAALYAFSYLYVAYLSIT